MTADDTVKLKEIASYASTTCAASSLCTTWEADLLFNRYLPVCTCGKSVISTMYYMYILKTRISYMHVLGIEFHICIIQFDTWWIEFHICLIEFKVWKNRISFMCLLKIRFKNMYILWISRKGSKTLFYASGFKITGKTPVTSQRLQLRPKCVRII
jgi:hypothetical protein